MQDMALELGESVFAHRKSHVVVLSRTSVRISSKGEYQSASPESRQSVQTCELWFPRARIFHLSLRLVFADGLDFTLTGDLKESVADHIENAEVSQTAF